MNLDRKPKDRSVRYSLIYVLFAGIWIVVTDFLVKPVFGPAAGEAATAKGLLFVALTGAALYGLLRHSHGRTERMQAAIIEHERRYRSAFGNTHTPMLLIDPVDARIVEANAAAADLYGLNRLRLPDAFLTEISTDPSADTLRRLQDAASGRGLLSESRHFVAGGEVRQMSIQTGPIDIDGRRQVLAILQDVTVHRRNESAIEILRKVNEAALQGRPFGEVLEPIADSVADAFDLPFVVLSRLPDSAADGDASGSFQVALRRNDVLVEVELLALVRDRLLGTASGHRALVLPVGSAELAPWQDMLMAAGVVRVGGCLSTPRPAGSACWSSGWRVRPTTCC